MNKNTVKMILGTVAVVGTIVGLLVENAKLKKEMKGMVKVETEEEA